VSLAPAITTRLSIVSKCHQRDRHDGTPDIGGSGAYSKFKLKFKLAYLQQAGDVSVTLLLLLLELAAFGSQPEGQMKQ
jgi:hypothetical protein